MILSTYKGLKVGGLACCVPENAKKTMEYAARFGTGKVEKFMDMTGVEEKHDALERQTASDLAFVAAEKLLEEKLVCREAVGVLVFVTETPDYITPSTAFVLQHRLGLGTDCICFDVNLGCSGFVSGLNTLAAIMTCSNIEKGLLLFGDTMSKRLSPDDRSICMLIGDAGGALLMEKDEHAEPFTTACISDGSKHGLAIIPAGGSRNPNAEHIRVQAEDGNIRGPYDFYMDGANIFFYSTSDVVSFVKAYLEQKGKSHEDYDGLILHQANAFILRNFAKRCKFPMEKVPISINRFGNTVGASVPVTMVSEYAGKEEKDRKLLLCAFGVGLTCALADISISSTEILPMIYSGEYWEG